MIVSKNEQLPSGTEQKDDAETQAVEKPLKEPKKPKVAKSETAPPKEDGETEVGIPIEKKKVYVFVDDPFWKGMH